MGDNDDLDKSLLGTAKIDADEFSAREGNPDRVSATKYAIAGVIYMLRREPSVRYLSLASLLVLVLALWLPETRIERILAILTMSMVWAGEFMNTALEAVVDLATDDIHPMAKVAKDVAAGSVFILSSTTLVIQLMIFVPLLIEKLS